MLFTPIFDYYLSFYVNFGELARLAVQGNLGSAQRLAKRCAAAKALSRRWRRRTRA